jgi:hypothetical protein
MYRLHLEKLEPETYALVKAKEINIEKGQKDSIKSKPQPMEATLHCAGKPTPTQDPTYGTPGLREATQDAGKPALTVSTPMDATPIQDSKKRK